MWINAKVFALIFVLIGLINAGLIRDNLYGKKKFNGPIQCSQSCSEESNKFNYRIGSTYSYDFTTKSSTLKKRVDLLDEIEISGHAKITVQSKCEHVLKLENIHFKNIDKTIEKRLIDDLEAHNLQYAFNDGIISNVCPSTNEIDWVLNIKKAILSSLQFSPNVNFKEVDSFVTNELDVIGKCETTYNLQNADSNLIKLTKTKNLNTCKQRVHISSSLFGNSKFIADLESYYASKIMINNYICKYSVKVNGIIESVKCTELSDSGDIFKPSLTSISEISLKFNSENPLHYPQLTGEYYKDTLVGHKVNKNTRNNKLIQNLNVQQAVDLLCSSIKNSTLDYKSIQDYRNLINVLQKSNYDEIKTKLFNLYDQSQKSDAEKILANCSPRKLFKIYLDAVLSTKTDEALKVIVNDIVPRDFFFDHDSLRAELRFISFYTSLAYYPDPTDQTLRIVSLLLKIKNRFTRNALFGVTGLAQNICQYKKDCNSQAILDLANQILEDLPANCEIKSSELNLIDVKLKSLQNLPILPESALNKLVKCFADSNAPNRIKLDAIQAFSGKQDNACLPSIKNHIKEVLVNQNQLSELRIYAYKIYKKCISNQEEVNLLQKIISEENNELTSYIIHNINNYRSLTNVKCPFILKYLNLTQNFDLKIDSIIGKSAEINGKFLPFITTNFKLITDLIYSDKTKQPTILRNSLFYEGNLIALEVRSETGSNSLLGLANIENLINGLNELIKSLTNRSESKDQNLLNELLAGFVSEFLKSIKDVDFTLSVGNKVIAFISNLDNLSTRIKTSQKLSSNLASILGLNLDNIFDIQTTSGISMKIDMQQTILANFALFNLHQTNAKETEFEITPNFVLSRNVRIDSSIPEDQFSIEKESYFTSNFGLKGTHKKVVNRNELRFQLARPKIELFTYRSSYRYIKDGQVFEFKEHHPDYESCLDKYIPIKKLLSYSICLKSSEKEKGLIIEKRDNSNILITYVNDLNNQEFSLEQENLPTKHKIYILRKSLLGDTVINAGIESPLINGEIQLIRNENKVNLNVLSDEKKLLELELDKKIDKQNQIDYRTKFKIDLPYLIKPLSGHSLIKSKQDNHIDLEGEFIVNDNQRLVEFKLKKEQTIQSIQKSNFNLKLFNLNNQNLLDLNYDLDRTLDTLHSKINLEYAKSFVNNQKEQLKIDTLFSINQTNAIQVKFKNNLKSSQFPILNHNLDHKFHFKYLEHIENDLIIDLEALGDKDESGLRFTHLSTLTKKGQNQYSTEHLIRILVKKLNLNREYIYTGNYDVSNPVWLIDDKFKITDLTISNEILVVTAKLDAIDLSKGKYKFVINYNCSKHGRFIWDEHINYDKINNQISTNIFMTIFTSDSKLSTIYHGEYQANDALFIPKKLKLTLKKENDKDNFLILERDFTKPYEKLITFVEYQNKRVFDFEAKLDSKNQLENLVIKANKLGEFRFNSLITPEGRNLNLNLNLNEFFEQNLNFVYGKQVISLKSSLFEKKNKLASLELFFKNPTKYIQTYKDVQSGSLDLTFRNYHLIYKGENQIAKSNLLLELEETESNCKLTLMATKDEYKLAFMAKHEKNKNIERFFDSSLNAQEASVIKYQNKFYNANLILNPFGLKLDDWKLINLEINQKNGHTKHLTRISLKKFPSSNQRKLVINTNTVFKINRLHEYKYDLEVGHILKDVKLNAQHNIDGELYHGLNLTHELNIDDKKTILKFNHHLDLIENKEYLVDHQLQFDIGDLGQNNHDGNLKYQLKSRYAKLNGIKIEGKFHHLKNQKSYLDLVFNLPSRNSIYNLQLNTKSDSQKVNYRKLKIDFENTQLKYKNSFIAKLDLVDKFDLHLKYDSIATNGYELEAKELHVLSKKGENSFNLIAPYGWLVSNNLTTTKNHLNYNLNIKKRGRIIFSVNSEIVLLTRTRSKRSINLPEFTIHTIFGYNGNPKIAEEFCTFKNDQIDYKLVLNRYNLTAKLQNLDKKRLINVKICSISNICPFLDVVHTYAENEKKTIVKFDAGKNDVSIDLNLDVKTLPTGEEKGTINGLLNNLKFTGESYYKPGKEKSFKLILPDRVILFKKEYLSPTSFKYSFWPNLEKDKTKLHLLTLKFDNKQTNLVSKYNALLELQHPAFQVPLKLKLDYLANYEIVNKQRKLIDLGLLSDFEYSSDVTKNLHFFYKLNQINSKSNLIRFYSENGKIDFGCSSIYEVQEENKYVKNNTCHWVDKDGKKHIGKDYFNFSISNLKENARELTFKLLKENLYTSFESIGKTVLNGNHITSLIDFNTNKNKQRIEINYENKCLHLYTYTPPKELYKNSRTLKACLNNKSNSNNLILIEVKDQEILRSKKYHESEKLTVILDRIENKRLHFVLRWDQDLIGEIVITSIEFDNKIRETNEILKKLIQQEFQDKLDFFKSILIGEIYEPWIKYENELLNNFVKEISPKFEFRTRRSIDESNTSKNWYEILFDVKINKISIDEGEINFYFRPYPTLESIRQIFTHGKVVLLKKFSN